MTYSGGGAENLEEAIVVWRAALELQPPKDSRSDSLHNLAQLLVLLSEKDGKLENLNETPCTYLGHLTRPPEGENRLSVTGQRMVAQE